MGSGIRRSHISAEPLDDAHFVGVHLVVGRVPGKENNQAQRNPADEATPAFERERGQAAVVNHRSGSPLPVNDIHDVPS